MDVYVLRMHKRLNITLPEETVRLLDRFAGKGSRSRIISEAVTQYVTKTSKAKLRRDLKEGARRNANRDLRIAEEWLAIEDAIPEDEQ